MLPFLHTISHILWRLSLLPIHSNGRTRGKVESMGVHLPNVIHGKAHLYLSRPLFKLLDVIQEWIIVVVVMLRVMTTQLSDAIIIPLNSSQEQAHSTPDNNWIPVVRGV